MFTDRTAQTRAHYAHAAQNTTSLAEVTGKTPAFVYLVILLLLSFIPTFMTQKKKNVHSETRLSSALYHTIFDYPASVKLK